MEDRVPSHGVGGHLAHHLVVLLREHNGEVPRVHRIVNAIQRNREVRVSQSVDGWDGTANARALGTREKGTPALQAIKVTCWLEDGGLRFAADRLTVQSHQNTRSATNATY